MSPPAEIFRAGTVKIHQCLQKPPSPGRKPFIKVTASLSIDIAVKSIFINGTTTFKIVHADMKTAATGGSKEPLQGLGLYFNLLESLLLFTATPIGIIPVAIVRQLSPLLACNAPMADFVESAGEIAMSEDHPGAVTDCSCRLIFRFLVTTNQFCLFAFAEQTVKQCDEVFWTVIHGSVIVRLYWKEFQQDIDPERTYPCKSRELSGSTPVFSSTSNSLTDHQQNPTPMPLNQASTLLPLRLLILTLLAIMPASAAWAAFGSNSLGGQDFMPVDEALPFSFTTTDSGVLLRWDTAPGHYLYRERISITPMSPDVTAAAPSFSAPGVETQDPYFGTVNVFHEPVEARVDLNLPKGTREATLQVTYQGCAEAGLCYPPQTRDVLYYASRSQAATPEPASTNNGSGSAPGTTPQTRDLDSATGLAGFLSEQSLAVIALVFLALGLGLTFTPCVLPMVPIISTLVSSRNTSSTGQALILAVSYVLGMALTYAAAGVVTGMLGASFNLQAQLQSPWVLGTFAALFVAFSLAMFNVFDLQLPQSIQNRLNQASQNLSGGRVLSVFGIGALSALVVSPCVSAPLAGSLLYISTTQDAVVGGIALFALGLGMGIPLILVAVGGRQLLPKTGAWMNVVKAFYGVMLLAVAIWLLERMIPAWLTLILWGLLAAITGVQLGAFDQARAGWQRTWKGAGLVLFAWGLALLAGALSGASDPLKPLSPFMASANGSASSSTAHSSFQRLEDPKAILAQLATASAAGQPVILDFYADWCISCKIMEREVFSKPAITNAMAPYTLLQIDMTDNTPEQQALLENLGLFGPPAILFYDAAGQEAKELRVLGEMDLARFREHLKQASSIIL